MIVRSLCPVGIKKFARGSDLTSRTAVFITLLLALLSISCLKPVDFSPDLLPLDDPVLPPPVVPVVDDPDQGTMTRATADQIFDLQTNETGLEITKFKSTALLASYLLKSSAARSVTITIAISDTFTIPLIDNTPVVSIAGGAFAPTVPGGEDDISTVIRVLELSPAVQSVGENLFESGELKVKTQIFLDIPLTASVFQGRSVEEQNDIAAKAAGQTALARTYDPSAPVKTPELILPPGIEAFSRPASGTAVYTVGFYDEATGLVNLSGNDVSNRYHVADSYLKKLFNAIYTPNAPESTDAVEEGKTTIRYNAAISQTALDLFKITIGTAPASDKVEIRGEVLPAADDAGQWRLIVIDIGLPGGADNDGLPRFYIPYRRLGLETGSYAHVRFRVNRGAHLVIEADNSGYTAEGADNSCPPGYFQGGCVEVAAGGKLRDGAYEGFPLGTDAVILCRDGSYLAVGPESTWSATTGSGIYYTGWLIGPPDISGGTYGGSNLLPRIVWDTGNGIYDYIEVRQAEIAIDAKVTAKRSFGLIYSVWFIEDAALVINIDANEPVVFPNGSGGAIHGVFANEDKYNFYGTSRTRITISSGSMLDAKFLKDGDGKNPISGQTIIEGVNSGDPVLYADLQEIAGYPIPYPSTPGS
jgi:hypothetical protein